MDSVRHLVSGKRHRYHDGVFDLDLCYVGSRIIAMGFPASGLEAAYRNQATDVARFLNLHHPKNYMIFNLSERRYDYGLFEGRVIDCGWPDHHTAPLHWIVDLAKSIDGWLASSPEHVAVVHCLAGKGRTGVAIAAYLLYSGAVFANDWDAKQYISEETATPALLQRVFDAREDGDGEGEDDNASVSHGGDSGSQAGSTAHATATGEHTPSTPPADEEFKSPQQYLEVDPSVDLNRQVPTSAELGARAILAFVQARGDGLNFAAQRRTVRYMAILCRRAVIQSLDDATSGLRKAWGAMASLPGSLPLLSSSSTGTSAVSTVSTSALGPAPLVASLGDSTATQEDEAVQSEDTPELNPSHSDASAPTPQSDHEPAAEAADSQQAEAQPEPERTKLRIDFGLAMHSLAELQTPSQPTVLIYTIVLHGVPASKSTDDINAGCRPSIQLTTLPYHGSEQDAAKPDAEGTVLWDSAWQYPDGNVPAYTRDDTAVVIPLNATVKGDVLLRCMHHRSAHTPTPTADGTQAVKDKAVPSSGVSGAGKAFAALKSLRDLTASAVGVTTSLGLSSGTKDQPPKELFRYTFNTAFMDHKDTGQVYGKNIHRVFPGDVDMEKRKKHARRLPAGFHMDVLFEYSGSATAPSQATAGGAGLIEGKTVSGGIELADTGRGDDDVPSDSKEEAGSAVAGAVNGWVSDHTVAPDSEVDIVVGQLQQGGMSL